MANTQGPDVISLPAIGNLGTSQIKVSVSAELMKNQSPASPIEPNQNLAVVQDAAGKPMLFSIGNDHRFHLIRFDETAKTGWSVMDLMSGVSGYSAATAFAVSQDLQGRISVLVALAKAGATTTDLFIANMLEPSSDWANFGALCQKVSGVDARFGAERMLMGNSDDGQAPIIVVVGSIGSDQYYYQVAGTTAVRFEFPQNVHQGNMMDLTIGYAFGQRGLFFLYKIGDGQSLVCNTLPTPDEGSKTFNYSPTKRFPPELQKLRYNCMATPTGSETDPFLISSDIFVGTDHGIYLFRDGKVGTLQKVTDQLKDVHELLVTQDADSISIWAMVSPNSLYYIYGQKGETYTWHSPVLFSETAIHIAPMRSQEKRANELFIVGQDHSITHYWQDPSTTLWQQRLIQVAAGNQIIEYNSFTTQIHLEDEKGRPLVGQDLKVTASQWVYVEANGLIYSLDKDNPASIKTDTMGNLTLITMADDIAAPIFHVQADCFEKSLNIYPNGKVQRGLAAIGRGSDLAAAKTQDGKPLVSGSYDPATLDGVASNIGQLVGSTGEFGSPTGEHTFVAVTDRALRHTGALNLAHLPDRFEFGMQVQGGNWKPMAPNSPLLAANGVGDVFGDAIDFVGDLFHDIANAFEKGLQMVKDGVTYLKDGVSFVIKRVGERLTLVLNLVDKVLNVVLDTLGAVFKTLDWLLKQIGIDLEKILEWLGSLFGWTELLETSDKIVDMVNGWMDAFVKAAPVMAKTLNSAITGLERQIADPALLAAFGGVDRGEGSSGGLLSLFQSPAANWPLYHILHGSFFSGGPMGMEPSMIKEIESTVTQLLKREAFTAETGVKQLLQALVDGISSMSIGEMFKKIVEIIAVTALEAVKGVVDAVFQLAAVLVKGLKSIMNYVIDVPILSTLVKLFLGGRKLTLLRVIGLILAIPIRLVHLLTTGNSLNNHDLTLPAGFDLSKMVSAASNGPQPVLRATAMSNEMAAASMAGAASDSDGIVDIPLSILITYETARFMGMIFSDLNLVVYMASGPDNAGDTLLTVADTICTVVALAMVGTNWILVQTGGRPAAASWAEVVVLAMSGLTFLMKGIGLRAPWKPWTRGISMAIYFMAIIVAGIGFHSQEHNRPNNLRFSGNLFLSLWNGISSMPFKVENPVVVKGVVAANSVAALAHIGIVGARWFTDKSDNVQFTLT